MGELERMKVKRPDWEAANERGFYYEWEMAVLQETTVRTLQRKRFEGKDHPPYKRVMGKVVYPINEYRKWIARHETKREVCETLETHLRQAR